MVYLDLWPPHLKDTAQTPVARPQSTLGFMQNKYLSFARSTTALTHVWQFMAASVPGSCSFQILHEAHWPCAIDSATRLRRPMQSVSLFSAGTATAKCHDAEKVV